MLACALALGHAAPASTLEERPVTPASIDPDNDARRTSFYSELLPLPGGGETRLPRISAERHSYMLGEPPSPRYRHTAIWTGTEMIVWGGSSDGAFLGDGRRYDLLTDRWRGMADLGAPRPRWGHQAVWTGSEMIVWGGFGNPGAYYADGARYDPVADAWRAMSGTGAPQGRYDHTAVWTGAEMVVWGGRTSATILDSGGRYDPATDTWRPTSTSGAPPPAMQARAVWTGSLMVVWGGEGPSSTYLQSGGRYDPGTDSWMPTSQGAGVPTPRTRHACAWTGAEMIVWDGYPITGTGARYDPIADAWTPMSAVNAPSPREPNAEVWTGSEMIVWGGASTATGARYDPVTDIWRATSSGPSAPVARYAHTLVWTGSEMIVWGGARPGGSLTLCGDGAIYAPASDSWRPMSYGPARPSPRAGHTAVWTGAEMIVWGGFDDTVLLQSGGRYDPTTGSWSATSQGANVPSARYGHTAVWTGNEMVVWGGQDGLVELDDGGRYDSVADAWTAVARTSATPPPRIDHTAVWTGTEMIVWGGVTFFGTPLASGGRYDPARDAWTATSPVGSPAPRPGHEAVWTGSRMIVWGGTNQTSGGIYDPLADTWASTTLTGAPSARDRFSMVWTGSQVVVWGGFDGTTPVKSGGRYDPIADSWQPIAITAAPSARFGHTAVWSGKRMIVWGAYNHVQTGNTGGRYDPATDTWEGTSRSYAPVGRSDHTAVWSGTDMVVWGGRNGATPLDNGGEYLPDLDVWRDSGDIPPDDVLVGKPRGGGPAYDARVRGWRVDGTALAFDVDAFPAFPGFGVRVASADLDGDLDGEVLAVPGPGPTFPPEVRGYDRDGVPISGLDFLAYGTPGYGAIVAAGAIDQAAEILTGPGPAPVYGPQVKAFRFTSAVQPIAKVNFFAYGTLRYGVLVGATDLDGDGYDEILSAAPPGAVFGPHVRGFDYDGLAVAPLPGVSFYAYGTPKYGVEAGGGDVDGDAFGEIVTGPGPSAVFGPQLRGFDSDGGAVTPISGINAFAFTGASFGLHPTAGDLDADGRAEIACGAGPDPGFGTRLRAFGYDGSRLADIPALSLDAFGLSYGLNVGAGPLGF